MSASEQTTHPGPNSSTARWQSRRAAAAASVRALRWRGWLLVVVAAVIMAVLVGVPTDLIDTPWFGREIAPTWWSYPVWVTTSAMGGLLVGLSSVTARATPVQPEGRRGGVVGAILMFLAVGCPVCNKVVLIVLGSSGAVTLFEPIQPIIAIASVLVLGWALTRRLTAGHCVALTGDQTCRPAATG